MHLRTRKFLGGMAALAAVLAIPAVAQDRPESLLPPGFGDPAPAPQSQAATPTTPKSSAPAAAPRETAGVQVVDSLAPLEKLVSAEPAPQVEYPRDSRRDPR